MEAEGAFAYFKGACVRDFQGEQGRIVSINPSFVEIGWELPDTSAVREEKLLRTEDRCRFGIAILTLDRGWVPLGEVLGPPTHSIVSEVRAILGEESDHNPFQNKDHLGPGPRGGRLVKMERWSCSGASYEQTCVGIAEDNHGRILRIKINPEYKSSYNSEYKRFVREKNRRKKRRA